MAARDGRGEGNLKKTTTENARHKGPSFKPFQTFCRIGQSVMLLIRGVWIFFLGVVVGVKGTGKGRGIVKN